MSVAYSLSRIKKLSPLMINQLAAGEVITRPAAVVKELLENAVDAGATHIEIDVTQGGMGMIEVSDNGSGIHPDDMIMAVTRHATSKVADVATLQGIRTLGFRGEALAAMAAVSRLTLTSSHEDSGIGRQLHLSGVLAETPQLTPVVRSRGTTVTVKDLYFNVPARRAHMKSVATEFMHIESIVRDVAIAYADVTLTLRHDSKQRLQLLASADHRRGTSTTATSTPLPLARLEQALNVSLQAQAIEVFIDLAKLMPRSAHLTLAPSSVQASVSGWMWPMSHTVAGPSRDHLSKCLPKLIYVNGRLIKDTTISAHLRQAAQRAGVEGIYYALYFELLPEWLNLNVHPAKQRIKISPLTNIMAHLSHEIQTKLANLDGAQSDRNGSSAGVQSPTKSSVHHVQSQRQLYQCKSIAGDEVSDNGVFDDRVINDSNGLETRAETGSKTYSDDMFTLLMASSDQAVHRPYSTVLPVCLAVVETLGHPNLAAEEVIEGNPLPWLVFYYQSKLLVIRLKTWYALSRLISQQGEAYIDPTDPELLQGTPAGINRQLRQRLSGNLAEASLEQQKIAASMIERLHSDAIAVMEMSDLVATMLMNPESASTP